MTHKDICWDIYEEAKRLCLDKNFDCIIKVIPGMVSPAGTFENAYDTVHIMFVSGDHSHKRSVKLLPEELVGEKRTQLLKENIDKFYEQVA